MMVCATLVLDYSIPIGWFELTKNYAHGWIPLFECRVPYQNLSAIN